jgi:uncharacterized protein YkwD
MMATVLLLLWIFRVSGQGAAATTLQSEQDLLALINAQRAKACRCGSKWYNAAPPLTWDTQLANAAQKHSDDMAKNRFFSHRGYNGSSMISRISAEGYRAVSCGENIFEGSSSAVDAINGWMKSPGHCANIMNSNYKDVGLASNNGIWTMVLASKGK